MKNDRLLKELTNRIITIPKEETAQIVNPTSNEETELANIDVETKVNDDAIELAKKIVVANYQDVPSLAKLFEVNQAKKEVVRSLKIDQLRDQLLELTSERLDKKPDEVTTKELMDFLQVLSNQQEKAQNTISKVNEVTIPITQINKQTTIFNLNSNEDAIKDRESRDKVVDFVNAVLKQGRKTDLNKDDSSTIVDVQIEESIKDEDDDKNIKEKKED